MGLEAFGIEVYSVAVFETEGVGVGALEGNVFLPELLHGCTEFGIGGVFFTVVGCLRGEPYYGCVAMILGGVDEGFHEGDILLACDLTVGGVSCACLARVAFALVPEYCTESFWA